MSRRTSDNRDTDPTQTIIPNVNTEMRLYRGIRVSELPYMIPPVLVGLFAGIFWYIGMPQIVISLTTIVSVFTMVASAKLMMRSRNSRISIQEMFKGRMIGIRRRRTMPWSTDVAAESKEHQVKRIFDDGTAELEDGTLVGMVRVDGRTTGNEPPAHMDEIVVHLSKAVDTKIRDFDFQYYSTTRTHDIEETISDYEERSRDSELIRGDGHVDKLLGALLEWHREVDAPVWDTKEYCHYVKVSVDASDVSSISTDLTGSDLGLLERKRLQQKLHERLSVVERELFASVRGVEAKRISPEEHAAVLLSYWTGVEHEPDPMLERKFNRNTPGPEVWPPAKFYKKATSSDEGDLDAPHGDADAHRLITKVHSDLDGEEKDTASVNPRVLAPGVIAEHDGYLEIGDEYVKTLWIHDFPESVESGFAEQLYSMTGIGEDEVNLDISINANAVSKQQALEELHEGELDIEIEAENVAKNSAPSARSVREDGSKYAEVEGMLRATNAQAWDVSMYVTIRAGTKTAINNLDDELFQPEDLDAAKMMALKNMEENVGGVIQDLPFDADYTAPNDLQLEAFKACSPNLGDPYNETVTKRSWNTTFDQLIGRSWTSGAKQMRVLGGFLGAIFPPCSATINEDGGLHWGREIQSGLPFRLNPSDRHSAPHGKTFGVSRSGKTHTNASGDMSWFSSRSDRALILCDTQGGFEGVINELGGKHIIVDSDETTFNPMKVPGNKPNRADIETQTDFFCTLIDSQGGAEVSYENTLEDAIERTHHRIDGEATVADLKEVLADMMENTEEYTDTTDEVEVGRKKDKIAEILEKFSAFAPGRKYEALLGKSSLGILDDDVKAVYVDLSNLDTEDDAEKSAMMNYVFTQASRKVKQFPGEVKFTIDEAHLLFHSEHMVARIERAAREWARYDGILHFISQNPREFVRGEEGSDMVERKRSALEQTSWTQIFNLNEADREVIQEFVDDNEAVVDQIKDDLTAAREYLGYTECVVRVGDNDKPGWYTVHNETSAREDAIINYDSEEHGDYDEYMAAFERGEIQAPVEQLLNDDDPDGEEETVEQLEYQSVTDRYAESTADD
jgi:hypothetical protein